MIDYNAIIFDMDGTLINSIAIWVEADKKFVNNLGYEYTSDVSLAMKTMHFESACEHLIKEFNLTLSHDEVAKSILSLVEHSYKHEMTLKPYAFEYIKKQHENGIKMCIATSNKHALAKSCLENLGIYDMMEFIITSDEVGNDKKSPDIFLEAARRMNSSPDKTLVFEDSIHAIKTAVDANFYTIGIYDDYSSHEFDEMCRIAQKTIKSYDEIM